MKTHSRVYIAYYFNSKNIQVCESPSLCTEMNVLSRSLTFNFRINIIRAFVNRETAHFRKLKFQNLYLTNSVWTSYTF